MWALPQPAADFSPCVSEHAMNINAALGSSSPLDFAALKADKTRQPDPTKTEIEKKSESAGAAGVNGRDSKTFSYSSRDLQHLMLDWGRTDSKYDVTGDGMVDVSDMLEVIGGIGREGTPWSPALAGDPGKLPMNQNTLDHLMVDWGQSNSQYDMTGDGIVNVSDLMHVIGNWDSSTGESPIIRQPGEVPMTQPPTSASTPPTANPVAATQTTTTPDSSAASTASGEAPPAGSSQPEPPTVAASLAANTAETLAPAKLNRLRTAII
jgi:hypothetical protein